MTALLEPPTTEDELRDRADGLAVRLEDGLTPPPGADTAQRAAARDAFFADLRAAILAIARSEVWRAHDLARQLLVLLEDLRDAIAADPEVEDPELRVREQLQRMVVVLRTMQRQLDRDALDRPEQAAHYVATALDQLKVADVAALLGTSPRMVSSYRRGTVGPLRKGAERVTLVGQLVYEVLRGSTQHGVLLWFDRPRPQLHGHTPRELLDRDPAAHRGALLALARGRRAQLDVSDPLLDGPLDAAA